MRNRLTRPSALLVTIGALLAICARPAMGQPLGTFSWQLQPFCNVITVNVVQAGSVYTLDGFDNQCGAAQRALVAGTATVNPDGSIGFGLHLVTSPGVASIGLEARISLPALNGTWQDSAGNSGTFAFNVSTGGSPRPPAAAVQVFSSVAVDFAAVSSFSFPVPIPPAVFNQSLWNIYLVRASGNLYQMPGPGVNGTSTYRAFSQPSGSNTNIVVNRVTGTGEDYAEVRVIRVR